LNWSAKLSLIVLMMFLCSCQSDDSNQFETEIEGETWRLISYINSKGLSVDSNSLSSLPDDHWLEFEESGVLNSQNACNACSGEYEINENNTLSISGFSCTEMACSGASYLYLMDDKYSYSLENQNLILTELNPDPGTEYTFTSF